jgi:hypothetical protein
LHPETSKKTNLANRSADIRGQARARSGTRGRLRQECRYDETNTTAPTYASPNPTTQRIPQGGSPSRRGNRLVSGLPGTMSIRHQAFADSRPRTSLPATAVVAVWDNVARDGLSDAFS